MIYLFEEQNYNKEILKDYLPDISDKVTSEGKLKCVGYYVSKMGNVFILPKVFLKDGKYPFGMDIQDINIPLDVSKINDNHTKEILEVLPNWLGRALQYYRNRKKKSLIVKEVDINIIKSFGEESESTLFEKIYSLEDFYLANKELYLNIYQEAHRGFNKVNWDKTIRKTLPYICKNTIIYSDLVTKVKTVNQDEELMILFFNTLDYIYDKYGFLIADETIYNVLPTEEFKLIVNNGQVLSHLLEIKNNYFSDKMCELWELLYAFHKSEDNLNNQDGTSEYMLVKKFEAVFEDMIDSLISDEKNELFTSKHQEDDKRIDHLFLGKSIFDESREIYYIGDSKYYPEDNETSGTSVGKQYTYATNLVQDAVNKRETEEWAKVYRDDMTEGYNLIPNFFIRGKFSSNYSKDEFMEFGMSNDDFYDDPRNHFVDRLFDRNTLFLLQYSVNFLYVLANYNEYNHSASVIIKNKIGKKIRKDFIKRLKKRYLFKKYEIVNEELANKVINARFRQLIGKIMAFYPKKKHPFIIVATYEEDECTREIVRCNFTIDNGFKIDEQYNLK